MICYKDRTFCSSDCVNKECYRYFGSDELIRARRWYGDDQPNIAWADFSKGCEEYVKP